MDKSEGETPTTGNTDQLLQRHLTLEHKMHLQRYQHIDRPYTRRVRSGLHCLGGHLYCTIEIKKIESESEYEMKEGSSGRN